MTPQPKVEIKIKQRKILSKPYIMLFGSVVEALNVEPAGKKNTRSINFQIVVITRKP